MTTEQPVPTGKAPKKARKKVTTDLGRQLLTRERQRLSREQAALAQQQLEEAERRRTQQKRNVQSTKPLDNAIARSIVKRFTAVLASEGVSVRIIATPAQTTSAWTDFEQIVINYRQQDDEKVLAATMRGLAYHEGGHCRWTLPFLDLAEAAGMTADTKLHHAWNCLEDQRMETAVTSDSPRKAAYLTPMVMLDLVPNVNAASSNWPLLVWRRYLPENIRRKARKLFVQKHNLRNDGTDGELLARAIEDVTERYVLADNAHDMWAAVLLYHDLLQQVGPMAAAIDDASMGHQRQHRQNGRNLDDFLVIPVSGSFCTPPSNGEAEEEAVWDTITTEEEFQQFLDLVIAILNGADCIPVIYAQTGSEPSKGDGAGSGQESDDKGDSEAGEGEEDGEGAGDEDSDDAGKQFANEPSKADKQPGGSTGEHKNTGVREGLDYKPEDEDEGLSDEELAEALADAEAERDADPTLGQDIQSLHEAINTKVSDLSPYQPGMSNDVEAKAAADNLAQDIERAFHEKTMEKAPGWLEGQRRGIVNVLRYETRRPGDVEFFKAYELTDAPGQNIAVSVLLDYSGSMGGSTKELAQAGYATKLACHNLGIPCTVILWDTNATVLYDSLEVPEYLPVIVSAGGTDPSIALADLDNQRYDKTTHIVIIMTDGQWSGNCSNTGFLANYKGDTPGRYFIGLGYSSGSYDGGSCDAMASGLRRYGCDESHGIGNLMEIPQYLEDALVAFSS